MSEVNVNNFKSLFPEIKDSFEKAKFISIDLEFSSLSPLQDQKPSLFDTPTERYYKLKKNSEEIIPIQVGITTFSFDSNKNIYSGKVYTFYVQPACFQYIQKRFYFQSDTISFLKLYNFDFNKFAYFGIPFINKVQEKKLRAKITNNELSEANINCRTEFEEILNNEGEIVKSWYTKARPGDFLAMPNIGTKRNSNEENLYFLQKVLRNRFKNLWTYIDESGEFIVKKVTKNNYDILRKTHILEDELINNLLGFSKVFRLLTSLKKPIVGHNLLQDLLLMISNFETTLPASYTDFKKLVVELFPTIFDTKTLSYNLRNLVPKEKRWADTGLNLIFNYFKNEAGRHLASNSPAIEVEDLQDNYGKFHDAGWDSFCTGYVFIRLAHLNLYQKFPTSKRFVSSEYIGGLMMYKNRVNVIRGSVSSINLDGPDPSSTRPPYLVIESLKKKTVSIPQITSLLSPFGFVEVKKFRFQRTRALVAVDNFNNARRILNTFKNDQDFYIRQYSTFRHSSVVRLFLMSSLTVSGVLVVWLAHSAFKR